MAFDDFMETLARRTRCLQNQRLLCYLTTSREYMNYDDIKTLEKELSKKAIKTATANVS